MFEDKACYITNCNHGDESEYKGKSVVMNLTANPQL